MLMITLYVKKLTSQNPKEWKYIQVERATEDYAYYLQQCDRRAEAVGGCPVKSFQNWLRTEI